MTTPSSSTTLDETKKYLRENFEQGCKCPACGQYVKRYKRKITSSMAYALFLISKHKGVNNPFHLEDFLKSIPNIPNSIRGDASKLRLWKLIDYGDTEPKEDGNPRDGWYFLTSYGEQFVKGLTKVRKYVYIYNNVTIQVEDNEPLVSFQDCLGEKFNYSELLQS